MFELRISECCTTPVYDDTKMCSNCNKECIVLIECPHCNNGQTKLGERNNMYKFNCVYCKGIGYINEEKRN